VKIPHYWGMTEALQSAVDSGVKALTSALNPKQIYLFGSCARGTATNHSAIDLLVALVTMTSGAETLVMAGETYSAMMAGRAIDQRMEVSGQET
jgi:predicted nucleotidyltransferase